MAPIPPHIPLHPPYPEEGNPEAVLYTTMVGVNLKAVLYSFDYVCLKWFYFSTTYPLSNEGAYRVTTIHVLY